MTARVERKRKEERALGICPVGKEVDGRSEACPLDGELEGFRRKTPLRTVVDGVGRGTAQSVGAVLNERGTGAPRDVDQLHASSEELHVQEAEDAIKHTACTATIFKEPHCRLGVNEAAHAPATHAG